MLDSPTLPWVVLLVLVRPHTGRYSHVAVIMSLMCRAKTRHTSSCTDRGSLLPRIFEYFRVGATRPLERFRGLGTTLGTPNRFHSGPAERNAHEI